MERLILLVTGGRHFGMLVKGKLPEQATREQRFVFECLDRVHRERGIWVLVNGGATGADSVADMWATKREVPSFRVPAKWKALGPRAGPVRNADMLSVYPIVPNSAVAFPGNTGTRDMLEKLETAGIKVWTPPFPAEE